MSSKITLIHIFANWSHFCGLAVKTGSIALQKFFLFCCLAFLIFLSIFKIRLKDLIEHASYYSFFDMFMGLAGEYV